MRLVEALLSTSSERLAGIAQFYGLLTQPDSGHGGHHQALASAVAAHLLVPANVLVAMNGLNQEEMLALRLITLAGGGTGVVVEQCHQKLNQLSRKWRRNGAKVIDALISRGLVFTKREGYRQVYFVPADLRDVLARFFLSNIFEACSVETDKFTPRNKVDFAAPLRHLCLLLSYLRKNEVKLTQAGTMFKKAQNDLAFLIGEEDAPPEGTYFPVRYPPRLTFLLYFAKSKNLVEERNGFLRLGQKASDWMQLPCSAWRKEMFDYWRQTFIAQDSDLQTLLYIIMHSPKDAIISLSGLLAFMDTLSTSHSSHGLNLRVERSLVEFLEYLGGLEVCPVLNDTHIRATALGKAMFGIAEWPEEAFDNYIYVQSNFEVLVPCTVEPKILWSIDAFADLVKPDQMMVYKLTRNSVYRALTHSFTPETIQKFLEKHSRTPVAQNITYSISHWGTSYGRLEFQEAILLKCDNEELANELMLSPKIRQYILHKAGPCYLIVDPECYEELAEALAEEGYMPKVNGRSTAPQPAPQSSQA